MRKEGTRAWRTVRREETKGTKENAGKMRENKGESDERRQGGGSKRARAKAGPKCNSRVTGKYLIGGPLPPEVDAPRIDSLAS